ncbi:MAG: phosphoribosylamine--glycine ligase [Candidatus Cloacimonetes bacterium HGW-Cloacimonetes-3]|nr:MAG: phosphoribosylamine--glycine ligase [Candidatus Cloacimonetes bacterium HGW-Cloacimonetes-3]
MTVLIIGSGGREHALAESFARCGAISKVIVAPGNAGIALQYPCVPLNSLPEIREYCLEKDIGMVFIGSEQPIADGLSDYLREAGLNVIAPSRHAAQLESSKIFAKELMHKWNIPTAKYRVLTHEDQSEQYLSEFNFPVVVKADGLAAGKGVYICKSRKEAEEAIRSLFSSFTNKPNDLQRTDRGVVLEEFLSGWEVSLFAISDGLNFASTVFAQDHKQAFDNDLGPNTGGMGAYAPVPEAEVYRKQIEEEIITPTLAAMRDIGYPYEGILYCGLMITTEGPKVIEFNCRFGDPEAEVLLPLLDNDLLDICQAILNRKVYKLNLKFKQATALGVVLASIGYPGDFEKGITISQPMPIPSRTYFSGVAEGSSGLVTSGGRVMCVVGVGDDLAAARKQAYRRIDDINYETKYCRSDIGLRKNCL